MADELVTHLPAIIKGGTLAAALMVAIIGHEIMHGYIAWRYGDATAKYAGRLSLNPLVHVDIVGTILVPLLLWISDAPFLFGWAKPVPVDLRIVIARGGYMAAVHVALAGIAYNLLIAIICAMLLSFSSTPESIVSLILQAFLLYMVIYNTILAFFNLWPIPPLDGSQALRWLAAHFGAWEIARFFDRMERYGMIILILILATPLGHYLIAPAWWIIEMLLGRS
ncbi:MAG: site-2 protease family protein [Campylobacterales bacterium]